MYELFWFLFGGVISFVATTIYYIYFSGWVKFKKEEWDNRFLKYKEDKINGFKVRWDYRRKNDGYGICDIELQCQECDKYFEIIEYCPKCHNQFNIAKIEDQIQEKVKKKCWKSFEILPKQQIWTF